MSAPAQKPRPAPVTTMAPTERSSFAAVTARDQLAHHHGRVGVQLLRPVEGDRQDGVGLLDEDLRVVAHASILAAPATARRARHDGPMDEPAAWVAAALASTRASPASARRTATAPCASCRCASPSSTAGWPAPSTTSRSAPGSCAGSTTCAPRARDGPRRPLRRRLVAAVVGARAGPRRGARRTARRGPARSTALQAKYAAVPRAAPGRRRVAGGHGRAQVVASREVEAALDLTVVRRRRSAGSRAAGRTARGRRAPGATRRAARAWPSARSRSTSRPMTRSPMPRRWWRRSIEQPPEVRHRVVGGGLGEHHEPGQLAVGLDRPHPRHDRRAVDDVREQGVGVGVAHRRRRSAPGSGACAAPSPRARWPG